MALRENGNSGGSRAMPLRENSDSGDPRAMPLRENSDSGDPRAMPLRENSDSGDPRAMPLRGPNINNSVVVVVPFSPEEQQQQQHNINQAALEKLLAIGIWESTAEELAADPWITVDRIERALADLMAQERAGQTWRTNRQAVLISNLRAHREPPRRRPPEDDRRRFVSGEYADIIEH
ncbi:MAG TPA: hypothetical protein ENJ31_13515 [Anaerolineae bacterium]|nr:hypothetical protein [Anaerolineae bacterium]